MLIIKAAKKVQFKLFWLPLFCKIFFFYPIASFSWANACSTILRGQAKLIRI